MVEFKNRVIIKKKCVIVKFLGGKVFKGEGEGIENFICYICF